MKKNADISSKLDKVLGEVGVIQLAEKEQKIQVKQEFEEIIEKRKKDIEVLCKKIVSKEMKKVQSEISTLTKARPAEDS